MNQTKITGIVGPKGSGKTYLASRMFGKENAAVFFDVAEDDGILPFATAIIEAPQYLVDVRNILNKEWRDDQPNRIVWRSRNLTMAKRGFCYYRDFDSLIQAMERIGSLTFYVDEAHQICNAWTSTPEFIKLIRMGRHYKINIVWISQRFATVNRELTANTDELIFFRLWEPLDLDAVNKRCGKKIAEEVRSLKRIQTVGTAVIPGQHIIFNVLKQ